MGGPVAGSENQKKTYRCEKTSLERTVLARTGIRIHCA